jgi:tripartite-type tricarboxylate transporter receptor subunit TctC
MKSSLRAWKALGLLLLTGLGGPAPAAAQAPSFPQHTVTVVVPFPPGGGTDVAARLVAQRLSQKWGQAVVVDNRAGAAGMLGADVVAKAKPDGYTLLVGNVGTQSINPTLYKKLPYNPDTAFAPISMVAELPMVLLASPKIPVKDLKELLARGKAEPDKFTVASSGAGGSPHLSSEVLQSMSGAQFLHVPYKGGGPAMADLMAGHVDLLFASVLEASGHVKSGKLRALGVSSRQRSTALPEVPTIAEAGQPGYESGSWVGYLAPAGTPAAIVQKVAQDIQAVLSAPDVRQQLIEQGAVPRATTPDEFSQQIHADRQRYAKLIEERGIRVD